jgi:hypothetical protein
MSWGAALAQLNIAEQRNNKEAIAYYKIQYEKELKMRNISKRDNMFQVHIERNYKVIFRKKFETLEEAITYRDECLLSLKTDC